MGRASDTLIPARFLLTVGHFIVVVLAFYHREANVAAGLGTDPSASDVTKAGNSLLAALGLSIICLALCLWGLMAGFTLFFDRLNTIHMVLHFFGGVLTAWYIVDVWGYLSYWWIWACFSLLPALCELAALLLVFAFKIVRY